MNHAPTSRTREKAMGDEAAEAELNLGEFQGVQTLTLSEAYALINALMAHRRDIGKKIEETECVPIFRSHGLVVAACLREDVSDSSLL